MAALVQAVQDDDFANIGCPFLPTDCALSITLFTLRGFVCAFLPEGVEIVIFQFPECRFMWRCRSSYLCCVYWRNFE